MIIRSKVDEQTLKKLGQKITNYIKFVVDVRREILAAGSERHFEDEQVLLGDGSEQKDLWGGGLDLETNELDFDSMINLRPNDGNSSREVLSPETRAKMERIVRNLLG